MTSEEGIKVRWRNGEEEEVGALVRTCARVGESKEQRRRAPFNSRLRETGGEVRYDPGLKWIAKSQRIFERANMPGAISRRRRRRTDVINCPFEY